MVKVTPKTGELSNRVQQKAKQFNVTSPQAHITNEEEVLTNAVNDWQNQNLVRNSTDSSQLTDSIPLSDGVSSRVLGLMAQTDNSVVASNSDVTDTINPFMPIVQVKTLPSRFTPYKLLVQNPEIIYKPYKFGEIKKMNQSKMSVRQLFKEVLNGIECNFDKELITLADFTYIGLLRRVSTLRAAKFNANFICQACGHQNKQEFEHDKLHFQDLECELPATVDFGGKDYTFTPLTIKDYLLLYDLDKLDDQIAFFAVQCRNTDIPINYPDKDENGIKLTDEMRRFYTIYDIFYNLTSAEDGEVLDMLDTYLDHKLKPVTLNCVGLVDYADEDGNNRQEKCDNQITVTLDGGGVVITPFRESDEPVKSRIRFGIKKHS